MNETKNIVIYLLIFIICTLVILMTLAGVSSREMLTRLKRNAGIFETYRFMNLGSANKNIVAYTMNSCGACPSQRLKISNHDETEASFISNFGSSFFHINIPPLSISDTVDAVVNETGFFSERNVSDPLLTVDLLKTSSFLDFWIDGKNKYGPTFNPDTYVLSSVYGYEISTMFTDRIPPAIEFSYLEGTCASTGLCIRNTWQGYVVDIGYGSKFDGISSYFLTVQGLKNIPLHLYSSYLYSHEEPTNSEPHFHLAPRLNNTNIQNLNPETGSGTCYDFWGIKITRTASVGPSAQGNKIVWTPQKGGNVDCPIFGCGPVSIGSPVDTVPTSNTIAKNLAKNTSKNKIPLHVGNTIHTPSSKAITNVVNKSPGAAEDTDEGLDAGLIAAGTVLASIGCTIS